jgi:hypothetical protein
MKDNFLHNVKHIHPPISNSESKEEAEGGLDDASCCASYSWLSKVWRFITNMDEREYRESLSRERDKKVDQIMRWFERHSLPDSHYSCDCGNQCESTNNPR